jgi:crotonobetainyl-CoA:carnitine CoA-transferase CaiB-like acyl-CoA transferase
MQPSTRGTAAHITQAQVDRAKGTGSALFMSFPDNEAGERPYNRSPAFNSHARNKRSMTLDIMTPEGQEMFRRLIAESDVFVENNVPETIERANATYEELSKVNPKLIMLRMPGYGLDGPYKNYRTFGTHMEGMAGHHHIRSYPDLDPSMTGDSFTGDAAAGVQGAFAVMLALRQRKRTGKGQQIEMALAEGFIPYMGEFMMDYSMNGRITEPQGNRHRSHAPHNVYPCQGEDRWIVIDVGTPEEWSRLTGACPERGGRIQLHPPQRTRFLRGTHKP